jgi:hypothetical protein
MREISPRRKVCICELSVYLQKREISLRGKKCITKKILFKYVTFGEKYTIEVDIIVENEP